jgi:fibronectin type 3 domain-containing protein
MRLLLSTSVTTYHNDNSGTGQNLNETILTPANVNVSTFGKQFSTPVDGQIYAQPLYVSGVNITAGRFAGVHDVTYVATQHDSLYAIDAHGGNVLWHLSFLDPATPGAALPGATAISTLSRDIDSRISPEMGITGTPVVDSAQHAIFVVTETKQIVNGKTHYVAGLFKVDIQNGAVMASKVIGDTTYADGTYTYRTAANPTSDQDPFVVGAGVGSISVSGQQRVYFNVLWQTARPGLMLHDGRIYTTWASESFTSLYHGWILGFDENTLAPTAVFNTTPGGTGAGIWQGAAVDSDGNFYAETGNGTFDGKKDASGQTVGLDANGFPVNGNYGDAIVKIVLDGGTDAGNQNVNGWGLRLSDYFAHRPLSTGSYDLGVGGVVILPDAVGSAAHPHLLIGSSREGTIYLVDRDNMGKFDAKVDHVVQEQAEAINDTRATPALFNDGTYYRLYFVPDSPFNDHAKSFTIADGAFSTSYESQSPDGYGNSPGSPSVSANGSSNGIVWAIDAVSNQLRAYDAMNLARELWTSDQAAGGRDALGKTIDESVATVADGQVFAGTSNALVAYGPPVIPTVGPAAPTELTATPRNYQLINLAWQDNSNNEDYFSILRSTDGISFSEVGRANANVQTYVDTYHVVSETHYYYKVEAHNGFGGGADSPPSNVAEVTTPLPPVVGNGDGAAASYFNDVNGQHLTSPAALTRIDPQINFNWVGSSPGAPVGVDYFSARWTGRIKAQYSEPYTFYTLSDDGVRLYIKPTTSSTYTTLVDDWTLHAPLEDAGTFMMSAGQYYDFKMEYFENYGGAVAELLWSSPSTVKAVIPKSQLYSGLAPVAPSSVVAKGGSGKVYLSWAATAGATTYRVYRSTTPGGEGAVPLAVDITDPTYVDTTATGGTTYYYTVTATNDGGESAPSNERSVYSHIPADANDDRSVDFNDLVALAQNYNTTGKTYAQGDFTGDGNVDFNDLVILAQHYNTTVPAAAAPGETAQALPIAGAAPMPSLATVMQQLSAPTPPVPVTKPAPKPVTPPTKKKPTPVAGRKPVEKKIVSREGAMVAPANVFGVKRILTPRKRSDLFG